MMAFVVCVISTYLHHGYSILLHSQLWFCGLVFLFLKQRMILWILSVLPGGHCGEFLIPQERSSSTTLFLSNKASRLYTNPRKGLHSFIELRSSKATRSHFHFILEAQPQIHFLNRLMI